MPPRAYGLGHTNLHTYATPVTRQEQRPQQGPCKPCGALFDSAVVAEEGRFNCGHDGLRQHTQDERKGQGRHLAIATRDTHVRYDRRYGGGCWCELIIQSCTIWLRVGRRLLHE